MIVNPKTQSPFLRIFTITILGICAAIPYFLTAGTLNTFFAEAGIDKSTIGIFAFLSLPYSLKLFLAPFVDKIPLPFLTKIFGQRRSYFILSQGISILAILCMAYILYTAQPYMKINATEPSSEKLEHTLQQESLANTKDTVAQKELLRQKKIQSLLIYIAITGLILSSASALQDIVIDAYRLEIFETQEQRTLASSFFIAGYRIGLIISGGGTLILADYFNWSMAYMATAAIMLLGTLVLLIAPEPTHSKNIAKTIPQWILMNIVDPFKELMQRPHFWIITLFIIFFKFGDTLLGRMAYSFYIETGFSKSEIAYVAKTFGLFITLGSTFLAAFIIHKKGIYKSLFLFAILQILSNIVFAVQAYKGHDLSFLFFTIAVENGTSSMATTAFIAYMSELCNRNYATTQYAILSSLMTLPQAVMSPVGGYTAAITTGELQTNYLQSIGIYIQTIHSYLPNLETLKHLKQTFQIYASQISSFTKNIDTVMHKNLHVTEISNYVTQMHPLFLAFQDYQKTIHDPLQNQEKADAYVQLLKSISPNYPEIQSIVNNTSLSEKDILLQTSHYFQDTEKLSNALNNLMEHTPSFFTENILLVLPDWIIPYGWETYFIITCFYALPGFGLLIFLMKYSPISSLQKK